MSKILDEATALTSEGSGRYVRDVDQGPFWGVVTAHGGYLMALVLQAMVREVNDPTRRPRMLSQHFLGTFEPGPIVVDVTLERVGRSVTSVSARLSSSERLVGLATALFAVDGDGPAFLDDPMPAVAPPAAPDTEMLGFFIANVHQTFEFHRRFGEDGASVPCEDGGWVVARDAGAWDHRDALVVSDVWVPPIIRNPERIAATPSLHHVAHFGPDVRGEEAIPFLVRHRMSSGGAGVTDEGIHLWAADGRLLMSAKQLRTAVSPGRVLGGDLPDDALDEAEETYARARADRS
jgi:acyl-CoA thioesterase